MSDPAFTFGAADVRARLPFRRAYDRWDIDTQWNYERGRAWALLAPRHIQIRNRCGSLNIDATRWFRRMSEIL